MGCITQGQPKVQPRNIQLRNLECLSTLKHVTLDHRELYRYDLNLDFESDTRRFGTLLKCPRIMEATQSSYHCLWYVPDLENRKVVLTMIL